MEIKLLIDEKEKTFVAPFVKGRLMRITLEMIEFYNKIGDAVMTASELDKSVDYICDVFGNKFTRDDVYDGVEVEDIMFLGQKYMQEIMTRATSKISGIEKNV